MAILGLSLFYIHSHLVAESCTTSMLTNKIRLLTVIDVFTREALAIEVGPRLCGEHVEASKNHAFCCVI